MPIRLAGKKKRGLDGSKKVKAGVNSSDIAFFFFWFNSINFCLPGVIVTTNPEKADNPNTSIADADKLDTDTADLEKADEAEADRADTKKVEEPGTGIANSAEAEEVETDRTEVNKAEANRAEANRAEIDGLKVDGAEADKVEVKKAKVDEVDEPNTNLLDPADPAEADGADK